MKSHTRDAFCWVCRHDFVLKYYHDVQEPAIIYTENLDCNDHEVCSDCVSFFTNGVPETCHHCDTEFEEEEDFVYHVLKNKIKCVKCDKYTCYGESYCDNDNYLIIRCPECDKLSVTSDEPKH